MGAVAGCSRGWRNGAAKGRASSSGCKFKLSLIEGGGMTDAQELVCAVTLLLLSLVLAGGSIIQLYP